jgi:Secretion system C-terminal sorting domain
LLHGTGNGITVIDSDGNVVFNKALYPTISDVIELPDSSIIFSLVSRECDGDFSEVLIFDKQWNQTGTLFGEYCAGPSAYFSNNDFVIADNENDIRVAKFNNNGVIWIQYIPSFNGINDLLVTPEDSLYLATNMGLIKMNSAGDVIEILPNLLFNRLELLPDGNFLAKAGDMLLAYSPDFQQLAMFQPQAGSIVDIAISSNEIAVLTDEQMVKRFDLGLVDLNLDIQLTDESFNGLVYSSNGLMLTGNEGSGSFIKAFALDGSTANTAKDIALLQVSHGSVTSNFLATPYWIGINDIKAIVKNEGPTVINRLNLNMPLPTYPAPSCVAEQSIFKEYENLNLEPGESVELVWGGIGIILGWGQQTDNFELCLFVSQPDHHLDTDNFNDASCVDVLLADKAPLPFRFHHAFNAVADELYIEMPTLEASAKANIFNAAGQLVHTEHITELRQTLQLQDLTDGIYFLQILSGNRVGWGRFAKY